MNEQQKEELVKVLVELIRQNPKVYTAIWDTACGCPNLVVQY